MEEAGWKCGSRKDIFKAGRILGYFKDRVQFNSCTILIRETLRWSYPDTVHIKQSSNGQAVRDDEQEHRSPRNQEGEGPQSLAKETTGTKERKKSEEIKAKEKG